MNSERFLNEKYHIEKQEVENSLCRRTGVIGYKVGMTGIWDRWGEYIPLTVIQIDRC